MKKILILLLILCSVLLCACNDLSDISNRYDKSSKTSTSVVDDSYSSELSETETLTEDLTEKIEVISEYTYSSGFLYTYHFVVVKNISDASLCMQTNTLAYGEDGSLISVGSGNIDIIEPGCTTIYYEAFETQNKIAKYETTSKIEKSKYYNYGISNLSYTITDIENGKIIQITNNGSVPIEFVEGYLLYFKNGELVGWDSCYFVNDEYEIKPGETISQQFSTYDEYDSVEFYVTGRG